jgi:alpha-amylase/alpha-mannosidase (GH57 family)
MVRSLEQLGFELVN